MRVHWWDIRERRLNKGMPTEVRVSEEERGCWQSPTGDSLCWKGTQESVGLRLRIGLPRTRRLPSLRGGCCDEVDIYEHKRSQGIFYAVPVVDYTNGS